MPAKRFDSVSCRARATARPPTPSAVRIGVTAMPRELSSTRPPTTRTTRRTDVRKSPVTPTASARRSLAADTSESSTPATVMVTDRMIAASSTTWIWTARRGGSSAISMATKRPSTTHQSSDGRRIAWRNRLSSVVRWPVQRRKPRISAFRKSSAATVTTTRATTGQKSRGHKACMRVHAIVGPTHAPRLLWLDRRRRLCDDRLRRSRLPLRARGVPRADRARHGLEPRRDLDGRPAELDRDGPRLVLLGGALRPHRRARRRGRRRVPPPPPAPAFRAGAGAVGGLPPPSLFCGLLGGGALSPPLPPPP